MIEVFNFSINELVFQKDPALKGSFAEFGDGRKLDLVKDGCAFISLYNVLRLCGYTKNFQEYSTELVNGGCINDVGEINWPSLNKLNLKLKFIWMQDNEIPNCEKVNINRVKECELNSENIAILKVQSMTSAERKHFMIFIELVDEQFICLESSGKSGKIEQRNILPDEILGVRYLKKKSNSE